MERSPGSVDATLRSWVEGSIFLTGLGRSWAGNSSWTGGTFGGCRVTGCSEQLDGPRTSAHLEVQAWHGKGSE